MFHMTLTLSFHKPIRSSSHQFTDTQRVEIARSIVNTRNTQIAHIPVNLFLTIRATTRTKNPANCSLNFSLLISRLVYDEERKHQNANL